MGRMIEVMTSRHKRTERDYLARMNDDKVECMVKAREYEYDYWDGDRRYGYGGYRYLEGYWKPVAQQLIDLYGLTNTSKVLDVGCGKAHIIYEMSLILPGLEVTGFDISAHAVANVPDPLSDRVSQRKAEEVPYPFEDNTFDLVFSMATLHNLRIFDLQAALSEVERVGKQKFIMVESFRSPEELFNLQCWALTANAFFTPEEWVWLFDRFGYTGDYEFIYFE